MRNLYCFFSPDVLMLRVLTKCLINFDQIGSSIKFMDDQIPEIIRKNAARFMNDSEKDFCWTASIDINCIAQVFKIENFY